MIYKGVFSMAKIKLIRIDSRLIHGQVITKWLKVANAKRIIIIDDELANDSFMGDIYRMAAPQGIGVEIYDVNTAVEKWKENEMGEGEILVLFKNVSNCYHAFKNGFPVHCLQIGGIGSAPGRTTVFRAISFDKTDVTQLQEIQDTGTEVNIHIIPEESKVSLNRALAKFTF